MDGIFRLVLVCVDVNATAQRIAQLSLHVWLQNCLTKEVEGSDVYCINEKKARVVSCIVYSSTRSICSPFPNTEIHSRCPIHELMKSANRAHQPVHEWRGDCGLSHQMVLLAGPLFSIFFDALLRLYKLRILLPKHHLRAFSKLETYCYCSIKYSLGSWWDFLWDYVSSANYTCLHVNGFAKTEPRETTVDAFHTLQTFENVCLGALDVGSRRGRKIRGPSGGVG